MPLALRLAIVYGTLCIFTGVYLPYFPVWLKSKGLGPTEISLIVALSLFLRLIVSPFFASVADRLGDRRRVVIWLSTGALVAASLFFWTDGFGPILLVALILNVIYPSIGPLVETISMRARLDHGINYGRVRLWGSVTFIGASAFTGWLLEWTPASIILICFMVTLAVNLGGAHLLPREAPPQKKRVSSRSRFADVLEIGRHPIFILFVLTSSLAQATHAVYYAFGTLAWQKQGYPDTVIGLLWATGVVAEIILFYISGPLMARLGAVKLLIIATGASVIRWTITAFSPHIALLFVVQALHALTFGAAHLGAVQFVAQAAPPRVAATAQSLYAAMASGVMMGLMTISIGPLYESIGAHTYFAMAGAGALALAGALLLAVRWNGQALVPEDEPGSEQDIEEQEVAK